MSTRCMSDLDLNFRTYSRSLLLLAGSLHRARELRNLFVELCQMLDAWRQNGYSASELEQLLSVYTTTAKDIDVLR